MKINKYPDSSSYVEVGINSNDALFRLNSYEDLWHLNQYVDAYNNYYKDKPTIIIPCLIDAQADKRFAINQSSGLKLVCEFLNKMNANFKIFHPHNPEVVEALMDNVEIIDNTRFIVDVLWDIKKYDKELYPAVREDNYNGPEGMYRDSRLDENLILMSSDAGGFKPLIKLCDKINWQGETFSASKYRVPYDKLISDRKNVIVQKIDRQDFEGKDILIIDDICVYGGTFKGLSKLLKERNCGKLYLAVSHMTVQNLGEDPVTNYFDKVFTTNSKFDEYYTQPYRKEGKYDKSDISNLKIIKMF